MDTMKLTEFTIDRPCLEELRFFFIRPDRWEENKDKLPKHRFIGWLWTDTKTPKIPHIGLDLHLKDWARDYGLKEPRVSSQVLHTDNPDQDLLVYLQLSHAPGWIYWILHFIATLGEDEVESRFIPLWIRARQQDNKTTITIEEHFVGRRCLGSCCFVLLLTLLLIFPAVIYFFVRWLDRRMTKRFAADILAPALETRLRGELNDRDEEE
jgi:hypothetical protein